MPSSLFRNSKNQTTLKQNKPAGLMGIVGQLTQVVGTLQRCDPNEAADKLAAMNPAFAEFRKKYQNATLEQIAQENGFDVDGVRSILQMLHLI